MCGRPCLPGQRYDGRPADARNHCGRLKKECYSKPLTCDDFRGIAISPIISKVFEHCILDRFGSFFDTADNQFGFKRGTGCNFAIRVVRNIVENFSNGGSTSNLCAIDLSKLLIRLITMRCLRN